MGSLSETETQLIIARELSFTSIEESKATLDKIVSLNKMLVSLYNKTKQK